MPRNGKTKYLKGPCQHCGGRLEFPAESIGLAAPCPHCGQETELLLASPPSESVIPKRVILWTGIAVLILSLGLAGSVIALKRAQRLVGRQRQESTVAKASAAEIPAQTSSSLINARGQSDFLVSEVRLEKAPGTSLIYAVGTLKNTATRRRFGVKIELDLFDADQNKLGTATDYNQAMEAGGEWRFKALAANSKVASAQVASVKEDQ